MLPLTYGIAVLFVLINFPAFSQSDHHSETYQQMQNLGHADIQLVGNFSAPKAVSSTLQQPPPGIYEPDDVFVAYAEAAAASLQPKQIQYAVNQLEKRSTQSLALANVLLIQGDFERSKAGSISRAQGLYHRVIAQWPATLASARARIRKNDYILHNRFREAIADNEVVLRDYPNLSESERDWAIHQNAIYSFQIENYEMSKNLFERVLRHSSESSYVESAKLHLKAIDNPASVEGMQALYQRAERVRFGGTTRQLSWNIMRQFRALAEKPFFKTYIDNSSIPSHERAEMLYRLVLVDWELGNQDAICEACDNILANYHATTETLVHCLYTKAYHHSHCGFFKDAAELYRKILDKGPSFNEVIPKTYRELANCLVMERDYLQAALLLSNFCAAYPYRTEAVEFAGEIDRILSIGGPELALAYKNQIGEEISSQKQ